MEYVTSEKGRQRFADGNYIFWADGRSKANPNLHFWRCSRKPICKARLHTIDDQVVNRINDHSHIDDSRKVQVARVIDQVREGASTSRDNPQTLINHATLGLGDEVRGSLDIQNMKRTIQRQRVRDIAAPINPRSLATLRIPLDYQQITLDDNIGPQRFLLYDSGQADDRILIFGTDTNVTLLSAAVKWQCDGTFKVVPVIAAQLYTIHVCYLGDYVPVVYALLPNKNEATYERFFRAIKQLAPAAQPISVLIDFEKGAANAIITVFQTPNNDLSVDGCFFHLNQNVCKRMQMEGLKARYENDAAFALLVRQIPALAFVPPAQVINAYNILEQHMPIEVIPILDYFERTYIGRRIGAQRVAPLFAIEFWNVNERVINDDPRTNNKVEGHHNMINTTLGFKHPTIWKFIDGLKTLQNGNQNKIATLVAQGVPPRKRVYVDLDNRLKTVTNDFANRTVMDFLRGVAHNLQFK